MSTTTLKRTGAIVYDHALRMWVPSRSVQGKKYLVELEAYDANGMCTCKDFACRFEKILKDGISPEEAVASGAVRLVNKTTGDTKHEWDALRCVHIIEARAEWADMSIRAISDAEAKHPNSTRHR